MEPSRETPWQLAKTSFRRDEDESQLRVRCVREGVDPETAVTELRRLCKAKYPDPTDHGYLEDLFVEDGSEEVKQGVQGCVVFGHEKVNEPGKGRPVAIKHISQPRGIASGERPLEVEAVDRIARSTKYLRRNLIEYLAIGFWDKAHQKIGVTSVVMPRAPLTLHEFIKRRLTPFTPGKPAD